MGATDVDTYYSRFGLQFRDKIEQIASSTGIDILSINGDILDKGLQYDNPFVSVLHTEMHLLEKLAEAYNFIVIILRGTLSHDGNQLNSLKFLENNKRIYILNSIDIIEYNSWRIRIIPEPFFKNYEEFQKLAFRNEADITLFHGTISGVNKIIEKGFSNLSERVRDILIDRDEMESVTNFYCTGGHFHGRQALSEKTWYTGSPYSWSYNDIGHNQKGFDYIISTEYEDMGELKREFNVQFIRNTDSSEYTSIDITDNIENKPIDEVKGYLHMLKRNQKYLQNTRLDIDLKRISPNNMYKVDTLKQLFIKQFDFKIEAMDRTLTPDRVESIIGDSDYILDTTIPIVEKIHNEIVNDKSIPKELKDRLTLERVEYITHDYIVSDEL